MLAHLPLGHGQHAQMQTFVVQVDQFKPYVFDGGVCVHTPCDGHTQPITAVPDGGGALTVGHVVGHGGVGPGRGADAPDRVGAPVLQQQPFAGQVGHGVVAPGGQLVELAVECPGVATTGFRYLGAKPRIGQYVDPRALRAFGCAALKVVATLCIKRAFGYLCGHHRSVCGHHRSGGKPPKAGCVGAALFALALGIGPCPNVVVQRPAIGLNAQAGTLGQGAELVSRQVFGTVNMQAGDASAAHGSQAGHVLFTQGKQFAVQGHEVGIDFVAQHHQVARHAAVGPLAQ